MSTGQQVKEIAEAAAPALNDALIQLMAWAQSGAGFVQEQMPILAREIVWFGLGIHGLWLSMGIVLLFTSYKTFRRFLPWAKEQEDASGGGSWGILIFSCCLIGAWGMALIASNCANFLKAALAPRLYLIEYLSDLVK